MMAAHWSATTVFETAAGQTEIREAAPACPSHIYKGWCPLCLILSDALRRRFPRPLLLRPGRAHRVQGPTGVDRQDVGPLEQLVLGNQECARGFGGLRRHVLALGNQIHTKSAPNPRDL
jgi:hypothetical protein